MTLGADSLDRIELVMACEETFDILIPDVDAKTMIRVQDVVMYIEARLTANT
jgi:acyl carrier protein